MSFSSNDSENAHHLLLLKSYYCNHLLDNNAHCHGIFRKTCIKQKITLNSKYFLCLIHVFRKILWWPLEARTMEFPCFYLTHLGLYQSPRNFPEDMYKRENFNWISSIFFFFYKCLRENSMRTSKFQNVQKIRQLYIILLFFILHVSDAKKLLRIELKFSV